MHLSRLSKFQQAMERHHLPLAVFMPGANFRYLTGHSVGLSERLTLLCIPASGAPALVAPLMEEDSLSTHTGIVSIYTYRDEEGPGKALRALADHYGRPSRFGAERLSLRLAEFSELSRAWGTQAWVDVGGAMGRLRAVKSPEEVSSIRRAIDLVEDVLAEVTRELQPGVSEQNLQQAVRRLLLEGGSEDVDSVAVASGPRSAFPHTRASQRCLQEGDVVWFDVCARVDGYYSDITRTFAVGTVAAELKQIFEVVLEAQAHARAELRPGMTCETVDALCREFISSAGYGDYFPHRTGHGLGLEIHEDPYMVQGNAIPLREGMVFTVEPGIYLPGRGGVRIEDDVWVNASTVESLTTFPRDGTI